MDAEIICVGTELLLGDIVNTNAAFLARELANIGINVYFQSVVGDNQKRLSAALSTAFSRVDLVLLTGGLGPTYDDLTKETVAKYFNRQMYMDETSLNKIRGFFASIQKPMTKNNEKQAQIPEGAVIFPNEWGTAPGIALSDGKKTAVMLPGPPHEMMSMFNTFVVPYLLNLSDKKIISRTINLFGIGESNVEDMLKPLMAFAENPTIAPYAKVGEVILRITAQAPTRNDAILLIDPVISQITDLLGPYIYGIDVPNIQYVLVKELIARNIKISVAESCTGGLISEQVTQIPGASAIFECGVCAYANDIKRKLLNVQEATLEKYGAVSEQTAMEMASGVRDVAGSDIGISTTGIAGPGGGTELKPVGTVFVGISSKAGCSVHRLKLGSGKSDDRERIRILAAKHALFKALKTLHEVY